MGKNRNMAAKNAKVKKMSMEASKDSRYRKMQAGYVFDDIVDSAHWHRCHLPGYTARGILMG